MRMMQNPHPTLAARPATAMWLFFASSLSASWAILALCLAAAAPSGGGASFTRVAKSFDRILQDTCQTLCVAMQYKHSSLMRVLDSFDKNLKHTWHAHMLLRPVKLVLHAAQSAESQTHKAIVVTVVLAYLARKHGKHMQSWVWVAVVCVCAVIQISFLHHSALPFGTLLQLGAGV